MKKNYFKLALLSIGLSIGLTACTNKLDLLPTNDITSAQVYSSAAGYKTAFAKVYGAFATTGNQGPNSGDIQGIDAGFSDFFRLFWKAQEVTTDEAVIGWGDAGLPDFHKMNWSANNPFLKGLYYRSFYQITVANDFIRQSSDAKLAERGISGADADNIRKYRAEARFIRAFQYWALLDLFGRPAFVTDADALGAALPQQATKADLFNYIQSELLAIEPLLPAPKTNEYGRADKGAAWALLARLYLNAAVYTGTPKYTEAITYSSKVISQGGYSLLPKYTSLMRSDNNIGNTEAIFTINFDGLKTQNWGGTTFLTHASVGGSMSASDFGVDGGWNGLRTTKNLVNLFPDVTGTLDQRAQFHTTGQSLEINEIGTFTDGYGVKKFRNIFSSGKLGSINIEAGGSGYTVSSVVTFSAPDQAGGTTATGVVASVDGTGKITSITITNPGSGYLSSATVTATIGAGATIKGILAPGSNLTWMDIDFPLFRLGEQYLIYAEAALRGGSGGNLATAVSYINLLRTRAVAATIVQADLTLPFILDERGRELYWEGHRRTDLIRYGKFTDASYLWPFKGDVKLGKGVESWRNVFPIPSDELVANPNLTQNPNY